MGPYASYVAVLDEPTGVDRWEDHLLDEAVASLRSFGADDWERLRAEVLVRAASWRARCAQCASEADPVHAVPLLLTLLQDTDAEVVAAAADSLHSLVQDGAEPALGDAARETLARLSTGSGLVATVASRLLARTGGRDAG